MRKAGILAAAVTVIAALTIGSGALAGSGPSVKFTTPTMNATTGSKATFKVKLSNFKINAAAVGKAPVAGQGHLHFQMDKGKFDFPKYSGANGKLAVMLGTQGTYSPAVAPTITYKSLPKGKHTLTVFLAANNHKNGKRATLRFTVK